MATSSLEPEGQADFTKCLHRAALHIISPLQMRKRTNGSTSFPSSCPAERPLSLMYGQAPDLVNPHSVSFPWKRESGGRSYREATLSILPVVTSFTKLPKENLVQMAVAFDVDRLETTGEPVRLGTLEGINAFVVSPDGSLIYFQPPQSSDPVWVDRQGHVEPLTTSPRVASVPRLSPDGHHLALNLRGLSASEIWTLEIGRGILSPLVQAPPSGPKLDNWGSFGPVWTPDGKELTFSRRRTLFQTSADRSGEPDQLIPDREPGRVWHLPCSWSPDGKVLAYIHRTSPVSHDIWFLPLGAKPEPFLATPAQEIQPDFSPQWAVVGLYLGSLRT